MPQVWLPTGQVHRPHLNPQSEREVLMNKLWDMRYLVPHADKLEVQQLRDIVEACERKNKDRNAQVVRDQAAALERLSKVNYAEVAEGLKEFFAWKRRKLGITREEQQASRK